MDTDNIKNVYVIDIIGKKFVVKYDGKNILLSSLSNNLDVNSLEYKVYQYINHELIYYNKDITELRKFLPELQKVINNSNPLNMIDNVRDCFWRFTNIFSSEQEMKTESPTIDDLKKYREEIINSSYTDESSEIDENISSNSNSKGKQKILSNGKSLLEKDAFVNALVLALLVEISGLVIFTMFLFKIL